MRSKRNNMPAFTIFFKWVTATAVAADPARYEPQDKEILIRVQTKIQVHLADTNKLGKLLHQFSSVLHSEYGNKIAYGIILKKNVRRSKN